MANKVTGSFQDGIGKIVQNIAALGMLPDATPDDIAVIGKFQSMLIDYSKTRAQNPMPVDGQQQMMPQMQGGMQGGMGMPQGPMPMGGGMPGLAPSLTDMSEIAKMLG